MARSQDIPLQFALSSLNPGDLTSFYSEALDNMMAEQPGRSGDPYYSHGRKSWTTTTVPGVHRARWEAFAGEPLAAYPFRPRNAREGVQALLVATSEALYYCAENGDLHNLGHWVSPGGGEHVQLTSPQFADNGRTVVIVDPPSGGGWQLRHPLVNDDSTKPLEEWELTPLGEAEAPGLAGRFGGIGFSSGRFLAVVKGEDQVRYSAPFGQEAEVLSTGGGERDDLFAPLSFITASSDSDSLLAIEVNERSIYLFGEKTVELFVPDPEDVFTLHSGGQMRWGCAGPDATATLGLTVFWLDDSCQLWMTDSFKPELVSQPAHSRAIRKALGGDLSHARLSAHAWNGHLLVCVHTLAPNPTFVYDMKTGFWHERSGTEELAAGPGDQRAWPVREVVNCYGKTWAVMAEGIGEYADGIFSYGSGGPFVRRMQTNPVSGFPNLVKAHRLELLASYDSEDPEKNRDPLTVQLWIHEAGSSRLHEEVRVGGGPGLGVRRDERLLFTQLGAAVYQSFEFRVKDGNRPFAVRDAVLRASRTDEDDTQHQMMQGAAGGMNFRRGS